MKGRIGSTALLLAILLLLSLDAGVPASSEVEGSQRPGTDSGVARSRPLNAPLSTAFTYQGNLQKDGNLINDSCTMVFALYDAASGGNPVGTPITLPVTVTTGLFTVLLDFGASPFTGEARWLEVAVQCPGDSDFTTLPRQPLTAAPYALYSLATPWDGIASMPPGFADGVDDDTTYSAGTGLLLTATTFAADPAYLQRRVADACGAGSAIRQITEDGTVLCEPDDDTTYSAGTGLLLTATTFSADPDYMQRRVNGTCAVGQTVRAVSADGTVVCQVDAPFNRPRVPAANTISLVDGGFQNGMFTALTIGVDGLGLISYWTNATFDLKAAHCNDITCTSVTTTTLDSAGDVGPDTSIAIGADGLGLISYRDWARHDLRVAHCDDIVCTHATTATLDSAADVQGSTSIAIGADGLGLISYCDRNSDDLRVAHCNDTLCSSATISTLDGATAVAWYSAVAIGADGRGLISYYDYGNSDLRVAHCDDVPCTSATISTVDSAGSAGGSPSVTIGADGLGLISYCTLGGDSDLRVAHCNNVTCTSATTITLDSAGVVGWYTSATIGSDGLGLISYYDATRSKPKVAHCGNVACTSATIAVLTPPYAAGEFTAVTVGVDGLGLISYYQIGGGGLMVSHCANIFCAPYFRRR